jgi:hypothetical protein
MHNIKEGHDVKASVGDTFADYAEAFKNTKRDNFFCFFLQIQKSRQKKLPDPIIFACLFILMGDVLELLIIKANLFELVWSVVTFERIINVYWEGRKVAGMDATNAFKFF